MAATRRLDAVFQGMYLPRTEADVLMYFRDAEQTWPIAVILLPNLRGARVTFSTTSDAKMALSKFDGRKIRQTEMFLAYAPTSKYVQLISFPVALRSPENIEILKKKFSAFHGELIRFLPSGAVILQFPSEADSSRAVQSLQEYRIDNWVWQLEFVQERGAIQLIQGSNLDDSNTPSISELSSSSAQVSNRSGAQTLDTDTRLPPVINTQPESPTALRKAHSSSRRITSTDHGSASKKSSTTTTAKTKSRKRSSVLSEQASLLAQYAPARTSALISSPADPNVVVRTGLLTAPSDHYPPISATEPNTILNTLSSISKGASDTLLSSPAAISSPFSSPCSSPSSSETTSRSSALGSSLSQLPPPRQIHHSLLLTGTGAILPTLDHQQQTEHFTVSSGTLTTPHEISDIAQHFIPSSLNESDSPLSPILHSIRPPTQRSGAATLVTNVEICRLPLIASPLIAHNLPSIVPPPDPLPLAPSLAISRSTSSSCLSGIEFTSSSSSTQASTSSYSGPMYESPEMGTIEYRSPLQPEDLSDPFALAPFSAHPSCSSSSSSFNFDATEADREMARFTEAEEALLRANLPPSPTPPDLALDADAISTADVPTQHNKLLTADGSMMYRFQVIHGEEFVVITDEGMEYLICTDITRRFNKLAHNCKPTWEKHGVKMKVIDRSKLWYFANAEERIRTFSTGRHLMLVDLHDSFVLRTIANWIQCKRDKQFRAELCKALAAADKPDMVEFRHTQVKQKLEHHHQFASLAKQNSGTALNSSLSLSEEKIENSAVPSMEVISSPLIQQALTTECPPTLNFHELNDATHLSSPQTIALPVPSSSTSSSSVLHASAAVNNTPDNATPSAARALSSAMSNQSASGRRKKKSRVSFSADVPNPSSPSVVKQKSPPPSASSSSSSLGNGPRGALSRTETTKLLIRAWFETVYQLVPVCSSRRNAHPQLSGRETRSVPEVPEQDGSVLVRTPDFLQFCLNPFLRKLPKEIIGEFEPWTLETELYTEWFLPELVGDHTRAKKRTGAAARQLFASRITELLRDIKDGFSSAICLDEPLQHAEGDDASVQLKKRKATETAGSSSSSNHYLHDDEDVNSAGYDSFSNDEDRRLALDPKHVPKSLLGAIPPPPLWLLKGPRVTNRSDENRTQATSKSVRPIARLPPLGMNEPNCI